MNSQPLPYLLSCLCFVLTGCDKQAPTSNLSSQVDIHVVQESTERWYSQTQLEQGRIIFAKHCASCHGEKAEATPDWKTSDAQGHYPPPPLNGSAHAWHHPLSALTEVIEKGGAIYGGQMPAWKGILTKAEILAAIASFQHYWPDETYQHWLEIEKQSRE